MDGGLLSLRWNDHGQTFFSMLSSVRKREVYCDVTLACDGRFYPVHKLVLSTCSDFFDQMFEKTACKHPVIVMANIAHKDLEALLNYMYLGEVNVLQTELSALMKAAEMLRIKGLAEPTKGLSAKDTREGKRTISWDKDLPDSKRRKSEEIPGSVSRLFQSSVSESDRTTNTRDTQKSRIANSDSQNSRLSIQIPTRCESSSSSSTDQIGTSSTEPPSQPTSQEAGASSQADPSFEPVDKPPRPEVKMEEVLVKEEPSGWFPDTEEGLESLQYSEPDTSLEYSSQQTNYQAGCLPWELAATQAQTLDTHLSQNIPGPSRIQGNDGSCVIGMGKRSSRGRRKKLTEEERQTLLELAQTNPYVSSEVLRKLFIQHLHTNISSRTIRRELIQAGLQTFRSSYSHITSSLVSRHSTS
ncbi:uncharacterized protein [Panulirus ornatus]|uniref:uncharacterized protein isoform X5 n=1 Tax=Panulirus ornatus TaxID=150431 RepID=UPI003A86E3DC